MSVDEFRDRNDLDYLRWLGRSLPGLCDQHRADLQPRDVRLHAAYCATITGTPARGDTFTGDWIKVCSGSLTELDDWAKQHTGAVVKRCGTCRPPGPAHP